MKIVFGLIAAFVMYHVYTTTGSIWYTIFAGLGVLIAPFAIGLLLALLAAIVTVIFTKD